MIYRLRILAVAERDIDEAAAFIAEDSVDAAARFYDAVEVTCRDICEHPKRWPRYVLNHARLRDVRKRTVMKFSSWLIFYRTTGESVEIIRVLHGARDVASHLL